jgi:hypothetical protein
VVIPLMAIIAYFIGAYWCLYILLMVINLVVIVNYCIGGY